MRSVCSSWLQPGVLWRRHTHTNLALTYAWPCMTLTITSYSCNDSLFCCGVRARNLCWSFQECCYNALLSGPDLLTDPNGSVSIASQNDGKTMHVTVIFECWSKYWLLLCLPSMLLFCPLWECLYSCTRIPRASYLPASYTGACCIASCRVHWPWRISENTACCTQFWQQNHTISTVMAEP